jgi:hypothetical protein
LVADIEPFIGGLATPSLQELFISDDRDDGSYYYALAPHFSRFIRSLGRRLFSAQLNMIGHTFIFFTRTHPDSDDPPLRIFARTESRARLEILVSATLSTVQEVFLASDRPESIITDHPDSYVSSWREFFRLFNNVTKLRISPGIEQDVRRILRHPPLDEELSLPLPTLEEIELNAIHPVEIDRNEQASFVDLFKPFMDARQQAGHPVDVWWNTDMAPSRYSWEAGKWPQ